MASNDMNFWDEDPEELLRQRWQQTFADFEVQSRTTLRQRILSQVTARNRPKPTAWLAGALLLLISAGLIYVVRPGNRSESARDNAGRVQLALPRHADRTTVRQPAVTIRPAASPTQAETGPWINVSVAGPQSVYHQPIVASSQPVAVEGSAGRNGLPTARLRKRTESRQSLADFQRPDRPFAKSPRYLGRESSVLSSRSVDASSREWATSLTVPAVSAPVIDADGLANRPVNNASPVVFAQLETPALSPLPGSLRALPASSATIRPINLVENRVRRRKQWFVDAVPLSSFQWMSTSPMSTAYLTHVNAPAAFSPATWGYQINGGIRWQRWQAYVSVGQLRRWAYYTVNENRYRIEPSPTDPYRVVQEKHVVAENVALPMIGAGLSQYRLLGQGRYVVELGGHVAYSPTSGQALAGLRGGASRRLPISQRLELQTGLTVEYGLNRLTSEQRQLVIHPIVVGVSVRICPRLYPPEK